MVVRKKLVEKVSVEQEKKRLNAKLESLQARKKQFLKKLGQTRQGVATNSRHSDRKFRENSARAVLARAKRADKAMLRTIEMTIRMVEKKLKKLT